MDCQQMLRSCFVAAALILSLHLLIHVATVALVEVEGYANLDSIDCGRVPYYGSGPAVNDNTGSGNRPNKPGKKNRPNKNPQHGKRPPARRDQSTDYDDDAGGGDGGGGEGGGGDENGADYDDNNANQNGGGGGGGGGDISNIINSVIGGGGGGGGVDFNGIINSVVSGGGGGGGGGGNLIDGIGKIIGGGGGGGSLINGIGKIIGGGGFNFPNLFGRRKRDIISRSGLNESAEFPDEDDGGDYRILHGERARLHEWPWIVRLMDCKVGMCSTCTGSLITNRWIISAGHCAGSAGRSPRGMNAIMGLYNMDFPEKTSFQIPIDRVVLHPRYSQLNNDVALFRLARPVKFNKYIQPVCLLNSGTKNVVQYAQGKTCYVVGYGKISDTQSAHSLQKLRIKPKRPETCENDYINGLSLKRGGVCIGPDPPSKRGVACQGDSGGPNLCYNAKKKRWQIFAVVSYGPMSCNRKRGDKWLSVAADLTSYRSWIASTIASTR